MATVEDVPPSAQPSQGNEVARYLPTLRETRSQVDRVERANGGDLQARLELIDIQTLARRPCKHQPDLSILDYLRDPGEGVAPHKAAEIVLSELADQTEETALDSATVFRYIQTYEIWKGHYKSAEELVHSLDNRDYVQANIVIGTSAQVAKRNHIRVIDAEWEEGWFDKIPPQMRPTSSIGPEIWSKQILIYMVATAKQFTLATAVKGWQEEIARRTDMGTRRRLGNTKTKVTPCLVASDLASLIKPDHNGRRQRMSDVSLPGNDGEEQLRVELIPPQSKEKTTLSKPKYTTGTPSRPRAKNMRASKRKRDEDDDADGDANGWRESADGTCMVKRAGKQLIRKPIEIPETESSQSSDPDESQSSIPSQPLGDDPFSPLNRPKDATLSEQQALLASNDGQAQRECEGPAFALGLQKFMNLLSEVDNPYTKSRCCDACRDPIKRAVDCLQHNLKPIMDALERISVHTFDGSEVPPAQKHGISPYKTAKRRPRVCEPDDSDAE